MALGLSTFSTVGSYSYTLPPEANRVDVILIGGGGGGGGGDGGLGSTGEGGKKATWQAYQLVRVDGGTWAAAAVTGVVGAAGTAGPKENNGGAGATPQLRSTVPQPPQLAAQGAQEPTPVTARTSQVRVLETPHTTGAPIAVA